MGMNSIIGSTGWQHGADEWFCDGEPCMYRIYSDTAYAVVPDEPINWCGSMKYHGTFCYEECLQSRSRACNCDTQEEAMMTLDEMAMDVVKKGRKMSRKDFIAGYMAGMKARTYSIDGRPASDFVSVYPHFDSRTFEDDGYEINWKAIGSVSIDEAREFAEYILECCDNPEAHLS